MQFKHPELLYALFLLLIPILVHLFQLRRFKKELFTNVAFLKQVNQQTRKSRELKKWLILSTRLLLLAAIILAFAQPFWSKQDDLNTKNELVVYLDNSFSMQANGMKGQLYLRSVQELLNNLDEGTTMTVFTNDKVFRNVTKSTLQNDLVNTSYSGNQLDYNAALLKGNAYFSNDANTIKQFVLTSDFQEYISLPEISTAEATRMHLVQLRPENLENSSIDSLYMNSNSSDDTYEIIAQIRSNQSNTPVSLYINDKLESKSAVNESGQVVFNIAKNRALQGVLTLDDTSVAFDNTLYFSINDAPKIKVLSINQASDDFLKRIFTEDEFAFEGVSYDQLNFNQIDQQDLIVLNELDRIDLALQNALNTFISQGNYIITIPSGEIDQDSYNEWFTSQNIPTISTVVAQENQVTNIAFDHPLYANVFDKKVTNFQYPKVSSFYKTNARNSILSFQDQSAFLIQTGNTYTFYSSLQLANTNFINSPLIVPTLYNIGKKSFQIPQLYYQIGAENSFELPISLDQDEIVSLKHEALSFIPLQQSSRDKVKITTVELPNVSGTYNVIYDKDTLSKVSYNYDRKEGVLRYHDIAANDAFSYSNSLEETLLDIKNEVESKPLWKWFVIFALLFLITEMLILRFFK